MRLKTFVVWLVVSVLYLSTYLKQAECEEVRMRIVVLNPSATLTQTKSVRTPLPKEITAKDIKDAGDVDVEYDSKEGTFFAIKNDIVLQPGETKVFEILLEDVWKFNEDKLQKMQKHTENIVHSLKATTFYDRAVLVAEGMYARIAQIITTQNNASVTTNQHISFYRDNVNLMASLEKDMDELEKLLVTAGGTVSMEAVESAELDVKGPDSRTTWIIIFMVLIFIGILGAVFYFTWHGQTEPKNTEKKPTDSTFKKNE